MPNLPNDPCTILLTFFTNSTKFSVYIYLKMQCAKAFHAYHSLDVPTDAHCKMLHLRNSTQKSNVLSPVFQKIRLFTFL